MQPHANRYPLTDDELRAASVPVASVAMLRATDGALFPEDLPASYSYNADGTLAHIEKTDGTSTWRYIYTWVNGKLTAESGWVLQ